MVEGPLPYADIPAMEAAFGLADAGGQGRLRPYVKHNEWFVARDWWSKLLTYQFRPSALKLPGLYRTRVFGLLARGMGKAETLAAAADLLQIKPATGRIRLFYLAASPTALTVKMISRDNAAHSARMAAERAAREALARLDLPLTSPPMTGYAEAGNARGICEQVVTGRRFSSRRDGDMFADQLLTGLSAYWQARGTELRPLSACIDVPAALNRVAELADSIPAEISTQLHATASRDPQLLCGWCHGDLTSANLTVHHSHLILLDWERSHFGALAIDLLALPAKKPILLRRVAPLLSARHCPEGTSLTDLAAAFVLRKLINRPKSAPRLCQFFTDIAKLDSRRG